jgi:hypothetical protein
LGSRSISVIEEWRVFQVATFGTLHLHHNELDQNQLPFDVMTIADEVEAQQAYSCFSDAKCSLQS